jgi:hypothetical protein
MISWSGMKQATVSRSNIDADDKALTIELIWVEVLL